MLVLSVEKYKSTTYCIELDNDEKIYLHQKILSEYNIVPKMELTPEDLEILIHASDFHRGRERALYILGARDYSYKEIYDKLQKNYSHEVSIEICDNLTDMRLIDDELYSHKLAQNYMEQKLFGSFKAKQEMRLKGISPDLITAALAVYEDSTDERIFALIERKYTHLLTDSKGLQKVKNSLSRFGYSYDEINSAIEQCDFDFNEEVNTWE